MENLMNVVPENLKQTIGESTPDDLISTSTSLLDFFNTLPLYHRIIEDLTKEKASCGKQASCGKNMKAAMELKVKGNQCFEKGDYKTAVKFYSKALRAAPANTDDISKDPVALLYGNRASAFNNMGLQMECLQDTTRALSIFPAYAKAWFRRGKAYASLGYYEDAIRSWNIASKLDTSLSGKKEIEKEIKMVINKKPKGATDQPLQSNAGKSDGVDEPCQVELQSIFTRSKGRGMVSMACIPEASLIHKEEAYTAIILEQCRETHCHFCFNELPADVVPCSWCSVSIYCSVQCQVQAGGQRLLDFPENISIYENLPEDLANYVSEFKSDRISDSSKDFTEHGHECQGVHWPLALPSSVVLAGRVLAKHIKQRSSGSGFDLGILDLCDNYAELPPETKLVFHIYSIALLQCFQRSYGSELPVNGKNLSEIIILLSQVSVNLMEVVCLKSSNSNSSEPRWAINASVKPVTVGLAVYAVGSLFNHSCLPNIHSYFISRTLYIRATEFVAAESHLELSYGPQVGQSHCNDRRKYLESRYSFWCECKGCTQPSLSDLVIAAYRCVNPDCFGVVLNTDVVNNEKQKFCSFLGGPSESSSNIDSGCELRKSEIGKIARFDDPDQWESEHCLKCQAFQDVPASLEKIEEATTFFSKLQEIIGSNKIPRSTISEAVCYLDFLRKILHPYNKTIAKVEDVLAQAFCIVGDFHAALEHCKKSTQVLIKLDGPTHISIANEMVKVASIQLSFRDHAAAESLNRAASIFSRYYGADADEIFPLMQVVETEVVKHGL